MWSELIPCILHDVFVEKNLASVCKKNKFSNIEIIL